jgi:uncharacterized protein (DUF2141 family)
MRPQGPKADIGAFEAEVEGPAAPSLAVNDVSHNEGNAGTTAFTFTVTRSGDTTGSSTVAYSTSLGTADAADLSPQSGTVSFGPGQTTRTFAVLVNGDTQIEPNETFFVDLATPTNATISDAQGKGTIVNDDAAAANGSIGGHVFDDRNANQTRDGGEAVLPGFTVFIDQNHNGRRDGGERMTVTNGAGEYRFSNLAAGDYLVRVELMPGYRQTKPSGRGGQAVSLKAGQNVTDRGFGVTRRASIAGTVFRDSNRNGRLDAGEAGLPARKVFLDADGDGKLGAGEVVALTDSMGRYTFASVAPGTVHLRLVLAGSIATAPSNGVYNLSVNPGSVITGRNFGLR